MIHILVVFFLTIIILILSLIIWHKTKEISFPIGIFLIYFFTLLGAVIISIDQNTGNFFQKYSFNYYYLYDKVFPVYLDNDYLLTIVFYSIFINVSNPAILKTFFTLGWTLTSEKFSFPTSL